jgi:hypothetical protein
MSAESKNLAVIHPDKTIELREALVNGGHGSGAFAGAESRS